MFRNPRALTRRTLLRNAAALATAASFTPDLLAQAVAAPVVSTPSGSLGGAWEQGTRVFRGVPFAEPPVGPLRFRPPVPLKSWTGTRDATRFASAAMQRPEHGISCSEDCLYLNVWAPAGKGPFPVLVWIHGGGYTGGTSFAPIFNGAAFAQAGIVVVTVAYRLGVFGFMDLESVLGKSYADSANNGTHDLVESLRWVQRHIAAFGGDPNHVTVGGESAGAKSAAALMAIPAATSLFHSVLSESGGGERVLTRNQAASVARNFQLLWNGNGGTRAAADLRVASAADLIATQEALLAATSLHFPFRCEIGGALLPKRPVDLVATGVSRGKRLLIGSNRDESALFLKPHPEPPVKPSDLGNLPLGAFEPVLERYVSVYPSMSLSQHEIRAVTAEEYWVPTIRLANAHVGSGGGDTWMYRLDFALDSGRYAGEAYHSEDLNFVWDKLSEPELEIAQAKALASQMHGAWTAFIQGRPPSAPGLPAWPKYTPAERPTMILDRVSSMETKPNDAELNLWNGIM